MLISEGYYIDDAGTPGVESNSTFLSKSRKSWCAVVVPQRVTKEISHAIDLLLSGVKQDYGAEELHFAEIYGGRGPWKGVPVADRVTIFDLMAEVLAKFDLPVIYQTASKSTILDHPKVFYGVIKKPGQFWDIKDVSHFGLLFLCHQISIYFSYLKENYPSDFPAPLRAYVDEGIAKEGATVGLPNWGESILGKRLLFRRSVDSPGLQLADFAAFSISRTQWIAARQKKGEPVTKADQHIMNISRKLNVFNLERVQIDPESFSREDYEHILIRDRVAKGLSRRPLSDE